jgi:hypothetical protein
MPDPDPEHEVGDIPRPSNRDIISPYADARKKEVNNTGYTDPRYRSGDRNGYPPPARSFIFADAGNQF